MKLPTTTVEAGMPVYMVDFEAFARFCVGRLEQETAPARRADRRDHTSAQP